MSCVGDNFKMIRQRLIYLAIIVATFGNASADENDCMERKPDYYRVFTFDYNGPSSPFGSKEDFERVVGACGDLDEHTMGMFDYFSSFGFDMSIPSLRQDPYSFYTSPRFNISHHVNEETSGRLIMGSVYEFGEYIDSQVFDSHHLLVVNTDITLGNGKTFTRWQSLSYGQKRFKLGGINRCMRYRTREPFMAYLHGNNFYTPLDLDVETTDWGKGLALSLIKSNSLYTMHQSRIVVTFPHAGP